VNFFLMNISLYLIMLNINSDFPDPLGPTIKKREPVSNRKSKNSIPMKISNMIIIVLLISILITIWAINKYNVNLYYKCECINNIYTCDLISNNTCVMEFMNETLKGLYSELWKTTVPIYLNLTNIVNNSRRSCFKDIFITNLYNFLLQFRKYNYILQLFHMNYKNLNKILLSI